MVHTRLPVPQAIRKSNCNPSVTGGLALRRRTRKSTEQPNRLATSKTVHVRVNDHVHVGVHVDVDLDVNGSRHAKKLSRRTDTPHALREREKKIGPSLGISK